MSLNNSNKFVGRAGGYDRQGMSYHRCHRSRYDSSAGIHFYLGNDQPISSLLGQRRRKERSIEREYEGESYKRLRPSEHASYNDQSDDIQHMQMP